MRAWVVHQPGPMATGPLQFTERPVPEPGPGQLLLKIRCCGVCRTDLHLAEGDLPPKHPDTTPGHEVVAEVVAAGPGTTRFQVGDRVGAAWLGGTDGSCTFCRRGQENLCPASVYTGWDFAGGYAEYMLVADAFAHPLPTGFSDAELAPLLCAGIIGYRALRRAARAARRHARHLGVRRLGAPGRAGRDGRGRRGARVHPRRVRPANWPATWAPPRCRTPSTRPRSSWTRPSCSPRSATWCRPRWPRWTGAARWPSPAST